MSEVRPNEGLPPIDVWVAYFSGALLETEEVAMRQRIESDPEWRAFAVEFGEAFASAPAAESAAVVDGGRRFGWRRVAGLVAATLVVGASLWFALAASGPTHAVDVAFARATQVSILGGIGSGAMRGYSPTTNSDDVVAAPGSELTVSVAVPEDACLWVFESRTGTTEILSTPSPVV